MAKETKTEAKPAAHKGHVNIFAALSAFQGELKPLKRSGKVQFESKKGGTVEFTYTPLDEIMTTIYPLLSKHGLSVRHEIVKDGARDAIVAILTHETYKVVESTKRKVEKTSEVNPSGASLEINGPGNRKETEDEYSYEIRTEGELKSGPVRITMGDDMKDTGAAITYARRYSLTMVLGLSSEEDRDIDLLEQSGKNAIQFAYGRAEKGIRDAKTEAELEKAVKVIKGDLDTLEKGKAPALGLSKEQYEKLIELAKARATELEA